MSNSSVRVRWPAIVGTVSGVLVLIITLSLLFAPTERIHPYIPESLGGTGGGFSQVLGNGAPKGVIHVTLLEFKDSVGESDVLKVRTPGETEMVPMKAAADGIPYQSAQEFLDLKHSKLPLTERPYIKSIRGGRQISGQDLTAGTTHAFVTEFQSIEHRDFFIEHDEPHKKFVENVQPLLRKPAIIVEFSDGTYTE